MAVIKRISSKATPKKIVQYLINKEKTEEKLISGQGCTPENIAQEFNATQELYNKTDGVRYHHVVQSFSPDDNITPEKAHALGKELAESQFKDFEVFIVTHTDKDHIHNHFVVNSVSFENGNKYRATNKSLWDIKRESNKLCERENLKTIDLDKKASEKLTTGELRMALRGQIPWKDELRQCISIAKEKTSNFADFNQFLKNNYGIETRITKKTISYKHPEREKPIRGSKLGADYDKEVLENEFTRTEKAAARETRESSRVETGSDLLLKRDGNSLQSDNSRAGSFEQSSKSSIGKATGERQGEGRTNEKSKRTVQGNEARDGGLEESTTRRNNKDLQGNAGRNKFEPRETYRDDSTDKRHGISAKKDTQSILEGKSQAVHSSITDNNGSNSRGARGISTGNPLDEILKSLGSAIDKANAREEAEAERQKEQEFKRAVKGKKKSKQRSKTRSIDWDMER